ncbi:putative bifunctional diguanylate cyclase/phosphodiesterase [Sporomusa sphaeroides]|uniref:Phytochrome-like protein cph2 n=1 Tax=Sporomusa sphaeroides DSM 2875 TaxID=1337886 RepID=A0ABM9W582_9FIRM|nr:bifunctional diguanylate cyclase/phosphodiesterase [Sporomusa sphaeroides]OLS55764.1 phytochrome-like protein cph2 [Sporomusa sphaeroides DSM 2875]CVK19310.1 Phytochrome-like protein cph2 [Sporomusa sphaeroides DSM 2875]
MENIQEKHKAAVGYKVEKNQTIDFLTNLPNRYAFVREMEKALYEAETECFGYVILVDIADFRAINQGYGYETGDDLIIALAQFLIHNFSAENYSIYRMNSDDFIVLCHNPDHPGQLNQDIEAIIKRFQFLWAIQGRAIYCSVNIAAVYYPVDGKSTEDIFRNLDSALYQAKENGKNGFTIYCEEIENVSHIVLKNREIEKMLRIAVKENFEGLVVHYQPIYSSVANSMIASEALLRYITEEGRMISPAQFIPIAERSGLIIPIGEFVLRSSAQFCKEMIEAGNPDFRVSVNVSIHQWKMPGFDEAVMRILDEVNVPCKNIVLEITEGMAATNINRIYDACRKLREQGVKIALDDFGTGYSSLNMIRTMPIDLIKIDQTFTNDVATDEYTHLFMRLITMLGHQLGIAVCVEGVEEEDQLASCKDMGVDYIQGYLYHKPVPAYVLMEMIHKERGLNLVHISDDRKGLKRKKKSR